jgi:hypothetical protein
MEKRPVAREIIIIIIIIILKCKELVIEVQRIWNMKAKVIPVITRVTGTILKSLRYYLSNVSGKHEIREVHKQPYCALHTYCGKC